MALFHDSVWRAQVTVRFDVNGTIGRTGFAEKKTEIDEWEKKKQSRYVV